MQMVLVDWIMKNLRTISFLSFMLVAICVFGQPAQQMVTVQVAPEHSDWLYKEGENVRFNVSVLKNGMPLRDMKIHYSISEVMMPQRLSETVFLKDGKGIINAGTMKTPGFLRCQVSAEYKGKKYSGMSTVGFSPNKISPKTELPGDFLQFWEKAKLEAAKIPMDVKMSLIPEKCTEKVNIYNVSLQNFENGCCLYGVLCVPKGTGKYPAILKLPSAGVRGYGGDVANAAKGYIIFEIGLHGIPVNLPWEVYSNLNAGALKGYHSFNLDDRDKYYYKRAYLGCVRAVDFISQLPEYDGENLITMGNSQGGALSIVTAALDSRVKGVVAFYPALCDQVGYLYNQAGGWPHTFNNGKNNTPEKIKTVQYYDVVNFARYIKVPGFYSFGYNDSSTPPTSVFSALNMIKAPKEIFIAEETGHYSYPEQRNASWKWVRSFLETNKSDKDTKGKD